MKIFNLFLGLAISLLATGCLSYMHSDVAVEGTLQAISKGDRSGLHDSLTGKALQTYGNDDGMVALKLYFGKYADVQVQSPHLIDRVFDGGEEILRVYKLDVTEKGQVDPTSIVAEFLVDCQVYWMAPHGNVGDTDHMTCLVSDIRLARLGQ